MEEEADLSRARYPLDQGGNSRIPARNLGQKRIKMEKGPPKVAEAARNLGKGSRNDPSRGSPPGKDVNKSTDLKELLNKSVRTSQSKSELLRLNSSVDESLPTYNYLPGLQPDPKYNQLPKSNHLIPQDSYLPPDNAPSLNPRSTGQRQMPQFNFS